MESIVESIMGAIPPNKKASSYDHISLVPREVSTLKSRSEADPGINMFGTRFSLPIIASPMPDVCGGKMAGTLAALGILGIIHRFQSIEEQVKEYKLAREVATDVNVEKIGCAVGVTGDYLARYHELDKAGCSIFCIDTANGANVLVEEALKGIRSLAAKKIYIIAGNVATREGYIYLAKLKVDAARCGLAGGSVCTTKTETGVYMPMATSIEEIVDTRASMARAMLDASANAPTSDDDREAIKNAITQYFEFLPKVLADGGIRTPADMCKAIALGADMVIAGGVFAGCEETPGRVIRQGKDLVKLYRGAASFSVQYEHKDEEPDYNEGDESFVSYKGEVKKLIKRFDAGLRSSMSYLNARTLADFKWNADIIDIG